MCEVIMNLTSKSGNFSHYGLRGINSWMWVFVLERFVLERSYGICQNVKWAVIAPPSGWSIWFLCHLILEIILNLTSKSCNFCPYGLREIVQNVKCAIIAPPLGQLIYGEMQHDPRTAGLLFYFVLDLWFMSYRPKRKEHCYSATIRPIDIILS